MKYFLTILLFACTATKPNNVPPVNIKPTPEPVVIDTVHQTFVMTDTTHWYVKDTSTITWGVHSVKDFAAVGNGIADDWNAIQTACDYCIANPLQCTAIRVPTGQYRITKSIQLQNSGHFFTFHLIGDMPAKSSSNQYLSQIVYEPTSGYAIGIQLGRDIQIENLAIYGKYNFPNTVTNKNIGTIKFGDWSTGQVQDTRNNPYAGMSIDPRSNESGSAGGTSGVNVSNCSINRFVVGIALSANGYTLNAENISIIDCNIEAVKVCVAIGQDQSKNIIINGLKVWASVHTILDGIHYGRGTGGGSVTCSNWNVAGNVNELFCVNTDRFPLSVRDIYAESLFKIGYLGNGAGTNFVNCAIDFLTGPGMPAADFLMAGRASFQGGCIRYYDGQRTHRMPMSTVDATFRDMTLNAEPLSIGVYGGAVYPTPVYENVHLYYSGKPLIPSETLTAFHTTPTLVIDRNTWTATMELPSGLASVGDYILGSPGSMGRKPYDTDMNPGLVNTIQIGRITSITGTSATLDDVGVNALDGESYDIMYVDKIKQ